VSNIGSYEERLQDFSWDLAREVLQWQEDDLLNIGHICSDRVCLRGKADKTALIWESFSGEKKSYTFDDVRLLSNGYARFLQEQGVVPGDRVCLFMDKIPALYIAFLGVLKMGAVAQPLFSAFGDDSLEVRLAGAGTAAILTTAKHVKKVRKIRERLPHLQHVILVDGNPARIKEGEVFFNAEDASPVQEFTCHRTGPESPSVLHYTSGTTGQPKGAQHVHDSVWGQALTAHWVLDLRDDDVYWCTADPGWVTGTSYGIIGPWALGITQCVLDAGFTSARWYRFIQDNKVTVWYSAPTAIRSLMRDGTSLVRQFDLSSLRHLCSVGEPLNAEAVVWSEEAFGRPFLDTFWQTETGAMMITNFPDLKVKPGSMGKPFPGIEAAVLDLKTRQPLDEPGRVGLIAFRPGWPSMFRHARRAAQRPGSLVRLRRPGQHRPGRLLLVRGPGRRRHQHRRTPGGSLRDRVGPHRTRGHRRGRGHRQTRPGEHGSGQGLRHPEPGFRVRRHDRAERDELHPQEPVAPGHAPGDRSRGQAAQDPQRQDPAPLPESPGMGRGDRRPVHPGRRLKSHLTAGRNQQGKEPAMTEMHETILEYVIDEYVDEDDSDSEMTFDTPLISSGIVDSFSMVSLKVFLEKKYGVSLPDSEATPEAFDTINSICELVRKHQG